MAKKKPVDSRTVTFQIICAKCSEIQGLFQTEDANDNDKRVILKDGAGKTQLVPGAYTVVWAIQTDGQRTYAVKMQQLPDDGGDPITLVDRKNETTTSDGRDVGFDEFKVT